MTENSKYLSYIDPKDVALRLMRRKMIWFHGAPKVTLVGDNGKFGKLCFDFHDDDDIVEWKIFISNRKKILDAARTAVKQFKEIVNEIYRQ
jgi:hypothetical protein